MHTTPRVLLTTALAAGCVAGTAQAASAPTLKAPTKVHVLDKVTATARHLPAGKVTLLATRKLTRDGVQMDCEVHLAAPRQASGTEVFRGSFPTGISCVDPDEPGHTFQDTEQGTFPGRWRVVVCPDGASVGCVGDAIASKPLTVAR